MTVQTGGATHETRWVDGRPDTAVPPTFLRLDRAELVGAALVIKAVAPLPRRHRRLARTAPLAYLYERAHGDEPESDLTLSVGHYDEANLVWSFSGEVSGIIGLTEPTSAAGDRPGHVEKEVR